MAAPENDLINQDGSISDKLSKARSQALEIQESISNLPDDSGSTDTSSPFGSNQVFMEELQGRLLGSSGMVSSSDSGLESEIKRAIDQAGEGRQARTQAIRSRFSDSIAQAQGAGERGATLERERTGGFATNLSALREVTRQTDQRIQALEGQREQALLQNRADVADRISDIILQEQQLEQRTRENTMSNLFKAQGLVQSQQQFDVQQQRLQQQFNSQEGRLQEAQDLREIEQRINFLVENGLVDQVGEGQLAGLEEEYGLPQGSLSKIKEKKELNLRSVPGLGLVNVTQDADGNPVTEVIFREPQKQSPAPEDVFEFDDDDIDNLTRAGFQPHILPGIQKGINSFGLEAVLGNLLIDEEPLTADQETALRATTNVDVSGNWYDSPGGSLKTLINRTGGGGSPGVEE